MRVGFRPPHPCRQSTLLLWGSETPGCRYLHFWFVSSGDAHGALEGNEVGHVDLLVVGRHLLLLYYLCEFVCELCARACDAIVRLRRRAQGGGLCVGQQCQGVMLLWRVCGRSLWRALLL